MLDRIATSIQKFGHFSAEHLSLVLHRLHVLQLSKGDFLVKKNQVCQAFYFINEGALRHYQVEENGKEITLNLFMKNEWIFEYNSFMTQQPSRNVIQAVTKSELFGLTLWDFHEIIKLPGSSFWPGYIFEQVLENQGCQFIRFPIEERYKRLLTAKPGILENFRHKHIASYLDMKPETLSRVRGKLKTS